ncbi:hypothetical protein B7494_g8224 [Chlorociboria aeruginascens]|nr:hypothetical protein B7494_g8224 [Chlorociboria aeruginascens]
MATVEDWMNDDREVVFLRVIAHQTSVAINSWSIYLLLENDTGSIRLNMVQENPRARGHVEVTENDFIMPTHGVANWDYELRSSYSVGWICSTLWAENYTSFDAIGGSGDRWWVYSVIRLLEYEQILPVGTFTQLYMNLHYYYSRNAERVYLGIDGFLPVEHVGDSMVQHPGSPATTTTSTRSSTELPEENNNGNGDHHNGNGNHHNGNGNH